MSSRATDQTIIVGAGIAGLTLGLALARLGLRSLILEAKSEPSTAGAGIQLGPNATGILDAIGVLDLLREHAGQPKHVVVRSISDGRLIATLPLPSARSGADRRPYLVVHRAKLHDALFIAARASEHIQLRLGFHLSKIQQHSSNVVVTAEDGTQVVGSIVIGCDGLWSRVRETIVPAAHLPYSGMVAARAVLPSNQAPANLQDPNTGVWLGADTHIVKYPVDAGKSIALVVVTRQAQRLIGWDHAVDPKEFHQRLPRRAPDLAELLNAAANWRQWALYDPQALPNWSSGRAIVIGDAAHPILPFLAQGAAMAIEDAFVLAALLAQHHGPAAFPMFEQRRRQRVLRVQSASRRNGHVYHLSGPAAAVRNATMALIPGRQLMRQYDWIYDWKPEEINSLS